MADDIAGTITPTYDASILVPADGDYANQAALVAMVKPIANRVEYLKQRFEDAPWARSEFFEDFVHFEADGANDRLFADTFWQLYGTNPATLGNTSVIDATTFGLLSAEHSAGTVSNNMLSKGRIPSVSNSLAEMSTFRRAVVRVKPGSIASGMNFEIGLSSDGTTAVAENDESITAIFQPSVSANWRLRTHDGGAAVLVDTGVPVVAGTWYQLDLQSDGVSVVSLSIDGDTPVIADPGDLPPLTTDCAFVTRFDMPNAGVGRTWTIDFIYATFDTSGRVL
jgi:hypothetical protein